MLCTNRTLSQMGRKRKRISACLDAAASCKATPPVAATESRRRNLTSRLSSSIWTAAKEGRLKLNFDGSSTADGSSIVGVYRDHRGNFVLGYAQRIHKKVTCSVAELMALKRGLELAVENGWRGISIEGDFESAVAVIKSRARFRSKKDKEQYTQIAAMLPQLGKTTVSHVVRKGNMVANGFAKLGHKAAALRLWRDVPPKEVLQFLERDAHGK